jgi:hypothetical protein
MGTWIRGIGRFFAGFCEAAASWRLYFYKLSGGKYAAQFS